EDEIERCALTGSCGAGAITAVRPILISPMRRVESVSVGGGAMTDACGPCTVRVADRSSGGGATTEVCIAGRSRRVVRTFSGGGATTEFSSGLIRVMLDAGTT